MGSNNWGQSKINYHHRFIHYLINLDGRTNNWGQSKVNYHHRLIHYLINLDGRTKQTLYIGKAFEKVTTTNGLGQKTVEYKHYIYAGGKLIATQTQVVESTDAEKTASPNHTHYLHADALGSIDTITDETGKVVQRVAFDPFGKRDVQGDGTALSDRGYTGHEHMDGLGLINMNARLYDAEIGRFVSPDTVIQAAALGQNYNRYSYVMNNPLKYTDSSGHLFGWIGKAIGGIAKSSCFYSDCDR